VHDAGQVDQGPFGASHRQAADALDPARFEVSHAVHPDAVEPARRRVRPRDLDEPHVDPGDADQPRRRPVRHGRSSTQRQKGGPDALLVRHREGGVPHHPAVDGNQAPVVDAPGDLPVGEAAVAGLGPGHEAVLAGQDGIEASAGHTSACASDGRNRKPPAFRDAVCTPAVHNSTRKSGEGRSVGA
jgi:hypothetical protein